MGPEPRRLRRAQAKAKAYRDRVGLTANQQRRKEIDELQRPLLAAIQDSASTSPTVIAAKLDVSLSRQGGAQALQGLAHCMTCSVVRSLLPQLPPDMAAALASIAAMEGTICDAYLRGTTAEIGGAA